MKKLRDGLLLALHILKIMNEASMKEMLHIRSSKNFSTIG